MGYHNEKERIIDSDKKKPVAIATHEGGADVIVKALNFYFGDTYTRNQVVEMMHSNSAMALNKIAEFAERSDMDGPELIDYLRETAEEMEAQALVVSLRDVCGFDKPKPD